MPLRDWIQEFRKLHELARKGELAGAELAEYHRAREELATALLSAQQLDLKAGQQARQSLRVQRTLQVDLVISAGSKLRSMTLDVSIGGFAAMLGYSPAVGESAEIVLRMPADAPISAHATVGGTKRYNGAYRVSFVFVQLPDAARERIEFLVFDTVLEALKL